MLKDAHPVNAQIPREAFLDCLPQVFCRFYCARDAIRFDYVSGRVFDWTGCTPEEFTAQERNWLDQVYPADRQLLLDAVNGAADQKEGFAVEYRLADGDDIRYVHHCARPVFADGDPVPGWIGYIEDITAFRQLRQDMERSQLLQSMGRLVAGIAHEINTPIQFIGDNLHFLAEAWEAMCVQLRTLRNAASRQDGDPETAGGWGRDMDFLLSEVPDAIRQSLEGIDRVSGLVSAMRDFSHPDERRMAAADLNRAVRSTLMLLRNELKYAAEVQTELDAGLPEVHCSIDEISRVLLNLLINAGHSIKEKIDKGLFTRGLICVRTRRVGEDAEIAVSDNGMGIPEAVRPRIFERFFTTKRSEQVKGTGQGLAIARAIVEEHHQGRLYFETEVEQGTTFYIRIPLSSRIERTAT